MSGFAKRTPNPVKPILPWHREAAKDCCRFGEHWCNGPGATLPDGTFGDNMAAIIAAHDPHAAQQEETVRLLSDLVELADAAMKAANRDGAESDRTEELKEIRTHLAALRGKGETA